MMKSDFNVEQIKKFWILSLIIECGSLKAAAIKAKVTPSAVSQAVSALEKNTGRTLLVRHKGSVSATPDALAILDVIRPAFEAFDKLNELNNQPIPAMRWLSFGTYESIAIDILPGLINRLRDQIPTLKLKV